MAPKPSQMPQKRRPLTVKPHIVYSTVSAPKK